VHLGFQLSHLADQPDWTKIIQNPFQRVQKEQLEMLWNYYGDLMGNLW